VHYLRAGSGSPIVIAHPTPATAWDMVPDMEMLAKTHTCFILDTPGLGLSDPLDLEHPTIDDIANAMAEAMVALKIPRCPALGAASGSAICLALARLHPNLVCGVICDGGVVLHTPEEAALYQEKYTPDIVFDDLGSHYTAAWTHFRDTTVWLPWYKRTPEFLQPGSNLAAPESTHQSLVTIFRDYKYYRRIVHAVVGTGVITEKTLAELQVPAIMVRAPVHPVFLEVDRIKNLKPLHQIVRIPTGSAAEKAEAFNEAADRLDLHGVAPADIDIPRSCSKIEKHFVNLSDGQVFVRHCGQLSSPKLLMLHDCPGSALALEPLVTVLSAHYDVYALDMPGCGESDPLAGDAPSIQDYVQAIQTVAATLKLGKSAIYGVGFGASVAAAYAKQSTGSVGHLILQSPLAPATDERADLRRNYAPPLTIESTGAHWYRTWLMLRDSQIYWPWYAHTNKSERRVDADFGAQHLHDWTFEVQKQWHAYHHAINAVLDQEPDWKDGTAKTPTLLISDPLHPFTVYDDKVRLLCPKGKKAVATGDLQALADAIGVFVAHG
jgi:pimeloyl-ACP methyl ester carboxylesterase